MTKRAFRLDQNVPERVATQLRRHGFDAMTIRDQNMVGAADPEAFAVCQAEDRVLVTFDLDFADIRTYPPGEACGTLIPRPPSHDARTVLALVEQLVPTLIASDPRGQLWIVEDGRIRMREGA